jgi:hypothetical protein
MKVILILASIFILIALIPVKVLEISGNNGYELVRVENGERIEISFIHSVELCRWIEIYSVDGNKLHLKKTLTKSAGWGLPSTENFSFEEYGGEEWLGYTVERIIPSLTISTHPMNDYILHVNQKTFSLEKFGKMVNIKIKSIPLLEYWRWSVWHLMSQNSKESSFTRGS